MGIDFSSNVTIASDSVHFHAGGLYLVDQRALPSIYKVVKLETCEEVAEAIKNLTVRGAMAIGVAAAYGVVLAALSALKQGSVSVKEGSKNAARLLRSQRPTARNLFWALELMEGELDQTHLDGEPLSRRLLELADEIARQTIETNRRIVEIGQEILQDSTGALTHCNSGPLAGVRYGTALGILIGAHQRGRGIHVFVDETRPLLQGARITAWELERAGADYTVIVDSAAGEVMREGLVDVVVVGADRIARNGDTANKIGTYMLAILSSAHHIPFYVAAPTSTIDAECPEGRQIVVEKRAPEEVRNFDGNTITPAGADVYNPAFDVTPSSYISGIITEFGILKPPFEESLA